MRLAASTSLTEAQSAALRKLVDLFHRAAEFMLQFGAKNFLRRMLSNSNDKEAMREFNERLGPLLQLLQRLLHRHRQLITARGLKRLDVVVVHAEALEVLGVRLAVLLGP